jgi:hypothetical protein
MDTILRDLLQEVEADLADFGEELEAPASPEQLAELQMASASQLAYALPAEYLEVLAAHDGLDCNGVQLYASEPKTAANDSDRPDYLKRGFVEANLIWREYEPNKHYAFFAESGDKLYCYNVIADQFEIVDRLTKTPIYEPSSFRTFNGLLKQVLNHMLDRYDEAE